MNEKTNESRRAFIRKTASLTTGLVLLAGPDAARAGEKAEEVNMTTPTTKDEKGINEKAALFENSPVPRYEDFSYYTYFKKFSTENYYTYNQQFEQCIIQKLNSTKGAEIDSGFLKGYIIKNGLKYILFEKGEKPLPPYEKELGLIKIYSSEDVTIYRVNSREATFLFPFILT